MVCRSAEASPARGREDAAVVDLRHDPGPLLLRVLLGVQARRVAVVVPNDHPDLTSAAAQAALAELVAPRLRLRYRRSTPGPKLAVVEAEVVATPTDPPARAVRALLGFLRRRGLKLGLLTNSGSPFREPFERAGLAELFDAALFSCDLGAKKPAPESYRAALSALTILRLAEGK